MKSGLSDAPIDTWCLYVHGCEDGFRGLVLGVEVVGCEGRIE